MLEGDHFRRDDYLSLAEIPESLTGYDVALPPDADRLIQREILPRVGERYPDLVEPLMRWLGRGVPVYSGRPRLSRRRIPPSGPPVLRSTSLRPARQ